MPPCPVPTLPHLQEQDWALAVGPAPFHFFPPNKETFSLLVLPKTPSNVIFLSVFLLVGKACRAPALGRLRGRLCSLLLLFWEV